MAFNVCRELYRQCISQSGGDLDYERDCTNNIDAHCLEHAPPSVSDVEEELENEESSSTSSAPSSTTTGASETSGTAAAETTSPSDNDADGDSAGLINVPGSGAAAVAALGVLAALL
jgi:hypothetical protein